ncbi:hypothetical protein BXZ70DRAFT_1010277 [Cristinia sonorae]|uniref:Uncharacterized protein n=1 Tax=Cristinia sonorae TaxID=1940300 RepID=A0A8K0UIT4_9AGAR|nr:hypothetical protein BXZ70DRAFT_1010277 [Cristinia sonorae]
MKFTVVHVLTLVLAISLRGGPASAAPLTVEVEARGLLTGTEIPKVEPAPDNWHAEKRTDHSADNWLPRERVDVSTDNWLPRRGFSEMRRNTGWGGRRTVPEDLAAGIDWPRA